MSPQAFTIFLISWFVLSAIFLWVWHKYIHPRMKRNLREQERYYEE